MGCHKTLSKSGWKQDWVLGSWLMVVRCLRSKDIAPLTSAPAQISATDIGRKYSISSLIIFKPKLEFFLFSSGNGKLSAIGQHQGGAFGSTRNVFSIDEMGPMAPEETFIF